MAHKDFNLPDLGEGLTEGEVVSWLVSVGDVIEVDAYVAEVETAKAVVEVPSPYGGTVVTLHGEPGDTLAVGSPLITIDTGGDDAGTAAGPAIEEPADKAMADAAAAESAEAAAVDEGSGAVLVGYGTGGSGGSRRARVGASGNGTSTTPVKVEREGRPLAKPPVRKLAKDLGVDLDYVAGSGEGGIITRADVEAAAAGTAPVGVLVTDDEGHRLGSAPPNEPVAPAPTPVAAAAPAAAPVAIPAPPVGELEPQRIKLNQMRKTIAAQMGRSRSEIPEAVTWVDIDATPLWDYRKQLNAAQSRVKVSALAIIMRACVAGLRTYPTINASLDTAAEEIVLHQHVNLGFAAQTDRGLVVPVIAGAHRKSTLEIAETLNEMAATAREGKLSPAQMTGGTFTISNYGAFGVDGGDMVINHPESAILGVGRIVDKPWVVDGELAVRKVMTLSIAFDHRISDGGEGAGFLRYVADLLENPTLLTAAL